jgi:hypothetical protein
MDEQRTGRQLHRYRSRIAELTEAINIACGIIEVGDQRLLVSDGPASGPPDISLAEWRRMYRVLDKARKANRSEGGDA